jgi:CRP/FNR family transcriptional regulator
MDKRGLLRSVFIFNGLEENLLDELSNQLKNVDCSTGQEIFKEKDTADSFFIVDSGEVIISKQLGPEHTKVLTVLGPGSVFGEMAFFSDSPRTANATARTAAKLWKVERRDFMQFIAEQPAAGLRILSGLLQVAMDRLEQTSRELATIYETGKLISSGKRLSEVARGISDELLLSIPDAAGAAVYLYNTFNEEFDPIAAPAGAPILSPAHALVSAAKENPGGTIIVPLPASEEFLKGAASLLLAPALKDGKLLGFMILWNKEGTAAFKNSHTLLALSVAGQFAEAVENLRYQQEERDRQRLNNARQRY